MGSAFAVPLDVARSEGVVERDGVRLAYAVHGDSPRTVVLLPTWSIVHSQVWKLQVPYLSRHVRVVTFDGRGCGASDRPEGPAAYRDEEYARDIVAVMDATETEQAVLVGLSSGATWGVHVAATHPDRVRGLVALSPSLAFGIRTHRDSDPWEGQPDEPTGWATYNRHYWLSGGWDDFVSFFFAQMFPEPHSSKQREDCERWAHEVSPRTIADTTDAGHGVGDAANPPIVPLCEQVQCPVLVVHGTDDRIRPQVYGERLAELTGGELLLVEGAGHGILARDPVLFNEELLRFVDRVDPPPPSTGARVRTRAPSRRPRALYLSSPIGLGHARRDLAIAREVRARRPELEIDWLAQDPVTRFVERAGEQVHPASHWLVSESSHIEHECGEHDLHAFQAIRTMDAVLMNNFGVFRDLLDEEQFDLVIADEAWDVDHYLHENPGCKRAPFAWLTDFVGWLPLPGGGEREVALTADYNAEMLEQRARFRAVRDASVFVGNETDVVDLTFGPGLPRIRDWTSENFAYSGYVTGFDPMTEDRRAEVRVRLGYRDDERVCLATVGGSGVGLPLLRRVMDAVPLLRRAAPELRIVVVTGPRIDPGSVPAPPGVDVVGYLPDLVSHLGSLLLSTGSA